jgi:hypothetical protein
MIQWALHREGMAAGQGATRSHQLRSAQARPLSAAHYVATLGPPFRRAGAEAIWVGMSHIQLGRRRGTMKIPRIFTAARAALAFVVAGTLRR